MRKLITLILVAALCYGGYRAVAPEIREAKIQSVLAKDPAQNQEYIAENLLNGKFISILSDEQLETIAEKVKNAHLLEGNETIRKFMEKRDIQPESLYENLKSRETLLTLKDQFADFLEKRYCQEHGVQDASQEEIEAYQKQMVSQMVKSVFEKLKEVK